MKNSEIFTLDNGLTVVYYKDDTKHSCTANLIVKYGGINSDFIINDKHYHINDGMAHFLEHLLIEHSIYGNALLDFRSNYIRTNGLTSSIRTSFYIDTVHDFDENLVKLIKVVNEPVFNEKDINETKYAVIEEIRKGNDNKFRNLDVLTKKCLFKNIKYLNNLGSIKDIEAIDYETAKLCYDTFYQPSNQILAISGNFDEEKTKNLIIKTYQKIDKTKINYTIPDFNEPNDIVKVEDTIKEKINTDYASINYKIDISKLSSYEKVKLTFYLNYFLEYNFNEASETYKYLIENKLSVHNIDTNCYFIDRFLIIEIGTYTDNKNAFIKLIKEKIENKCFNEEDFNLRKNRTIISLIMREENPLDVIRPFLENIISFNYYEMDKIEDIEAYTFDDYKELISRLDYTNYTVTRMLKKD